MSYQIGMEFIHIGPHYYDLRLTMGALAEISNRFKASGPIELAARLRHMSLSDARELLACLIRPSLCRYAPRLDVDRLAARISDTELQAALPKMCRLIEQVFKEHASKEHS